MLPDSSTSPRVSIILPAYNAARYLGAAIQSALKQTRNDFELLILDNASTDETPAVVAQFSDPRIRSVRHPENYGFAGNVARGFAMARGEYVTVLGADDIWRDHFLERTVAFLDGNPDCSFVHTDAIWIDDDSRPTGESAANWAEHTAGREAFVNCFRDGFCFSALVLRVDPLRRHGGFEQSWGNAGDLTLFLRLCLAGNAGYIREPLAWYRQHSENLTSTVLKAHSASILTMELEILEVALGWPEAAQLDKPRARRQILRHLAVRTIRMLHQARIQRQRWGWFQAFAKTVSVAPVVLTLPSTWARFGLGLLPRPMILGLQRWRHTKVSLPGPV